jgi:hypothetical protein
VKQVEPPRVALQQHADQHRKELSTTTGEHVLIAGPLPGRLVCSERK